MRPYAVGITYGRPSLPTNPTWHTKPSSRIVVICSQLDASRSGSRRMRVLSVGVIGLVLIAASPCRPKPLTVRTARPRGTALSAYHRRTQYHRRPCDQNYGCWLLTETISPVMYDE